MRPKRGYSPLLCHGVGVPVGYLLPALFGQQTCVTRRTGLRFTAMPPTTSEVSSSKRYEVQLENWVSRLVNRTSSPC